MSMQAVPYPHGWTPQGLASLLLWLDAGDLTTITKDGSNKVSAWNNKAGGGIGNMTQAASGNQPVWSATGLGVYAAIDFDCNLAHRMGPNSFAHNGPNTTLFYAGIYKTPVVSNGIGLSFASTGVASSGGGGGNMMRNPTTVQSVDTIYTSTSSNSQTITHGTKFLWSLTRNNANFTSYLNGGNAVSLNFASTTQLDLVMLNASITAAGAGGTARGHQTIGMVLATSTVDAVERQKIEGFVAWACGITLDASHPWRQRAP